MAEDLDARHDGGLKTLELRGYGNVLQDAVDAVANSKLVLERLQMNVRRAQFNRVAQHLVHEPNDGGFVFRRRVEVRVVAAIVNPLESLFFIERADRVRANAETLLHFPLNGFGGSEDRFEV